MRLSASPHLLQGMNLIPKSLKLITPSIHSERVSHKQAVIPVILRAKALDSSHAPIGFALLVSDSCLICFKHSGREGERYHILYRHLTRLAFSLFLVAMTFIIFLILVTFVFAELWLHHRLSLNRYLSSIRKKADFR